MTAPFCVCVDSRSACNWALRATPWACLHRIRRRVSLPFHYSSPFILSLLCSWVCVWSPQSYHNISLLSNYTHTLSDDVYLTHLHVLNERGNLLTHASHLCVLHFYYSVFISFELVLQYMGGDSLCQWNVCFCVEDSFGTLSPTSPLILKMSDHLHLCYIYAFSPPVPVEAIFPQMFCERVQLRMCLCVWGMEAEGITSFVLGWAFKEPSRENARLVSLRTDTHAD